MRIIVTGSRDWQDWRTIFAALNGVAIQYNLNYPPDENGNTMPDPRLMRVVHGACPTGADYWADQWSIANCDTRLCERHPVEWRRDGKFYRAAGFERNRKMVDLGADLVLAFQKNNSKGTQSTIDLAKRAGIPTRIWTQEAL